MSTVQFNQTIDNVSPLIVYEPPGAWTEGSAALDPLASSYSNNGTFTLCTTAGSSATFTFNGTQVYVFGAKRGNHGPYTVTLDGTTSSFDGAATPEIFGPLFSSPVLTAGQHTVKITNQLTDTNKPFLDIDFITWTTTAGQDGVSSTVEDTSSSWSYTPATSWGTDLTSNKLAGFSGNNGHVTLTTGASATLSFKGGHVAVFGPIGPTISRYTVKLDGQTAGTFNGTKQNYVAQTTLFSANGLGGGQHILEFISQPSIAGQMLAIDYAQVPGDLGTSSGGASSPTGSSVADKPKSSSIGPAVGGAIGGIAVLAILGLVFFCLIRRRRRQREQDQANGFGEPKYTGVVPAPSNYSMANMSVAGSAPLQDPYSVTGSQANLVAGGAYSQAGSQYQLPPAGAPYQQSYHSSVHSWNQGQQPPMVPPPVPTPGSDQRRTFYTVNNEPGPASETGSSSLGRSSTAQTSGAAGLGAGNYRRKDEYMPMPTTANAPLPTDAPRMQVVGRATDFGPVPQSADLLPPDYSQATEPYLPTARGHQPQASYGGASTTTSDPYGGYLSEAGSPTRSQFSHSQQR